MSNRPRSGQKEFQGWWVVDPTKEDEQTKTGRGADSKTSLSSILLQLAPAQFPQTLHLFIHTFTRLESHAASW
jgi:hypothetical protein